MTFDSGQKAKEWEAAARNGVNASKCGNVYFSLVALGVEELGGGGREGVKQSLLYSDSKTPANFTHAALIYVETLACL